jgi:hypothetical protein
MTTKQETKIFEFKHPVSGDVFTYEDKKHAYKLNGVELPGTTTPLKLVNELSWDADGKMTDKSFIIQQWALGCMEKEVYDELNLLWDGVEFCNYWLTYKSIEPDVAGLQCVTRDDIRKIVKEAKKAPNKKFTGAGISGTEIHAMIEKWIKDQINGTSNAFANTTPPQQVINFIEWANRNNVKFLYSEEPIYSKEWMNCGTVDFICEIDGKVLVGDIKTNGDKRRYEWNTKTNKYDFTKPVSDIHIPALWQCGSYAKMVTENDARKLVEKVDGVVVVNIKKSGEFSEELDVKYDYNITSLITAYDLVIRLYKEFRNKYNN